MFNTIVLIGCGGIGSWIPRFLIHALKSINIKIKWIFIDGDVVEEKNLLYSDYYRYDIGRNKAKVLGERYGESYIDKFVTESDVAKLISSDRLIITATDELRIRRFVIENAPLFIDVRAVDDMFQIFTWKARDVAKMFITHDLDRRASCQTDYTRIRFGNILAATYVADIVCRALRGEDFPPYIIHVPRKFEDKKDVKEERIETCQVCGRKISPGASLWYCYDCKIVMCWQCLNNCGCRHRHKYTRLKPPIIVRNDKIVLELELAKVKTIDEIVDELKGRGFEVEKIENSILISKTYKPVVVLSDRGQIVYMKPFKIVQKWRVIPQTRDCYLEKIYAIPIELVKDRYNLQLDRHVHPNVSSTCELCTGDHEIKACTLTNFVDVVEKNFKICEAILNAADDSWGYAKKDSVLRYAEKIEDMYKKSISVEEKKTQTSLDRLSERLRRRVNLMRFLET